MRTARVYRGARRQCRRARLAASASTSKGCAPTTRSVPMSKVGDPGHARPRRLAPHRRDPLEDLRLPAPPHRQVAVEPRVGRHAGQHRVVLEVEPVAPVGVHEAVADLVEPVLAAGPLGQRQRLAGVRLVGRDDHPRDALRLGEVDQVGAHLPHPLGAEHLLERHAAHGNARVQLEAAPVENDVELRLQPDQVALLRDEAEGSDEVGPDPYRDRHAPDSNRGHDPPHDRDPEDDDPFHADVKALLRIAETYGGPLGGAAVAAVKAAG